MKIKNKKLSAFADNNIYIILSFLCSAVLMLLVYYCYDIIPFGGKTVLRMDLFHQYGPLFAEFFDRLTEFKSFFYSWNTGGGGAFLGNYFNYLSSPVGDIIALVAGHQNIPEAIGVMVLVKNALAASTLAYYLKKKTGKNDFSITAFGLLYAFCGFFIAYYWNIMWIDAMYILPLAMLGIEMIIDKRSCKLYVVALAYSFFANYYMSYMICIFAIFWFLVHFISTSTFKQIYDDIPVKLNEEGKKESSTLNKLLYNKFLRSGFLFTASSVIAVALVAFAVLPTYFCLKECSATSGTFPSSSTFYNDIFDFLANHLASLKPTIRSSGDTVLPNVYCGVITIMLVPLYLFCDKISAKERGAHIILLAVFFIGFNLNYANYILHALHFPNDLPFRFSFIYSFLLVTMAYTVLTHIKDIPAKAVIASGTGVILFTVLVQRLGMDNVDDATVYTTIGFAALYTVVLGIMRKKEYAHSAVTLLLLCSVFAEVAVADIDHIEITQEKVNFVNGYSDFRNLKDTLDEREGTDKYRMELTDINTLMDASWFNYNGISTFSSMAYEKSANLQSRLGLGGNFINSYIYHSQTPVYNAMMGLKYIVSNDGTELNKELFNPIATCGKFKAYENKYAMPIAYAVSKNMTDLDSVSDDPFSVQNDFWYYATGMSNVLKQIPASDYTSENIDEDDSFLENSFTVYKKNSARIGTLNLNFRIPENQNVYLYFDSRDIESISVYTMSDSFSETLRTDEPYILDCGMIAEDEILTLEITIDADEDICSADCFVYGLDKEVLDMGYEILSHGKMSIDTFDESYIKGTVTVAEDKLLYTSINYDDGWTVKVDGKEVEKEKVCEALLAVRLTEGTHTIEMNYIPKGFNIGIIISVTVLVFIILYFILSAKSGKKNGKAKKNNSDSRLRELLGNDDNDENTEAEELRGIDAMMAEDLGINATVEQAEALLLPADEYDGQLEKNAEGLMKADELLNTQKLDLNSILGDLNNAEEISAEADTESADITENDTEE